MNSRYSISMTLILFLAGTVLLSARGTRDESVAGPAVPQVTALKIGTLPAESAIPIILAEHGQHFAEEGVVVEIVPFFSPGDRNVAFQAGEIDGFIGDIMTAVTFRNAGFPVVMTSDINEDFKLLTAPNSGIATLADLDGKDVSLVPGFILEYIMDTIAGEEGIGYSIVVIPSIPARFEALLADRVAAVLFTEPQATLLAAQGAGILTGSRERGIKAGAMIFSEQTVRDNPEALRRFYAATDRTIAAINGRDLSEYAQILSDYGIPAAVRGTISYSAAKPVDPGDYASVLEWMAARNLLKQDIPFETITAVIE